MLTTCKIRCATTHPKSVILGVLVAGADSGQNAPISHAITVVCTPKYTVF